MENIFCELAPSFYPSSIPIILRFCLFTSAPDFLDVLCLGDFLDLTFSLPGVSTCPICLQCPRLSSIICTLLVRLTIEDLIELPEFFLSRFTQFSDSISAFMV